MFVAQKTQRSYLLLIASLCVRLPDLYGVSQASNKMDNSGGLRISKLLFQNILPKA